MRERSGFTLIELLVVIGIIALLAGMLIPTISMIRRQAKDTQCRNNLQQIGIGITAFQQENNNYFPVNFAGLFAAGQPLANESRRILICPFDVSRGTSNLLGRPNNLSGDISGQMAWGDLSALHESGASYFFEASNRPLGATERAWSFADGSRWEDHAETWAEAKAYQLKHGNFGNTPFRPADFPVMRCFYHYKWKDTDVESPSLKKVLNLSWDMSIYWSIPFWEHQANPAIAFP